MKKSTRKTRSATQFKKPQCVEILIKKGDDTEITNASSTQYNHNASSSLDPTSRRKDVTPKGQLLKLKKDKGMKEYLIKL